MNSIECIVPLHSIHIFFSCRAVDVLLVFCFLRLYFLIDDDIRTLGKMFIFFLIFMIHVMNARTDSEPGPISICAQTGAQL